MQRGAAIAALMHNGRPKSADTIPHNRSDQMSVAYLNDKESAVIVRRLLKAAFPSTKFGVTIGRGAGVSSIRIRWTDGPTTTRVDEIVGFLEAGRFDGMTDSYEYDRSRFVEIDGVMYQPGCKYIFTVRSISPSLANRCIQHIAQYWGGVERLPVAVESYDGYKLEGGEEWMRVRDDLDLQWSDAIHRAARDRQTYSRTIERPSIADDPSGDAWASRNG